MFKGCLILVSGSVIVKMKNRGTIVVLNRYASSLCFLDVFGWWYDSGTLGVRMRYAHKFLDLRCKTEVTSYMFVLNALVKILMHSVINCYSRLPALSILRPHAFRIKNVVQQLTLLIPGCTVPILRLPYNMSVFASSRLSSRH